jgi:hypothetical protein
LENITMQRSEPGLVLATSTRVLQNGSRT